MDFGGNPDLDPNPGIFLKEFTIAVLEMSKASHRRFGNSPQLRKLADLKLNELKTGLAECLILLLAREVQRLIKQHVM